MRTMDRPQDIAVWLRASVTGSLQCDSRRLQPGDGFVAWPGAATDGRRYVNDALASGAVAALVEVDGVDAFGLADARVLAVPGLKAQAGAIASEFCDDPSAALDVLAFLSYAEAENAVTMAYRPARPLLKRLLAWPLIALGKLAGFNVDPSDFQSIAVPRTLWRRRSSSHSVWTMRYIQLSIRVPG